MLDSETKRRIDNARNVLVGKVPDPKAQVEQITTALIYKFMDDIDQESIELGGKASYFIEDYAKFAWPKIIDKSLSGFDRLNLYGEAITKLNQNKNLPQLFREIFKDAFLPYRDPETLNLFLKEINEFTYDHSERLGDAFEYLLSILGSQGSAGQFRTPRHIIDFIVDVVNPIKEDKVLDPACGTAGFLISAYKHILEKNKNKNLTPDEMAQLTKNFVGYDISPDMVRLSQVNMYLHKFQNPTIYEYDTLTSEERWDDTFDVILANPPFMTPKGGIRPHSRFSVQANRSEVLFVDYIAEHLNSAGRAGIIVPEGVIFQSSNAYKNLRKMLVNDNFLYAVVSLPPGVFNPYSGVKTSILFLDKKIAKKSENVLFINIKNDGFGLGAKRRRLQDSDLPMALKMIKDFQIQSSRNFQNNILGFTTTKQEILEDSDFSLSGGRYKKLIKREESIWPIIKLKNLVIYVRGVVYSKGDEVLEGGVGVLRANNIDVDKNIINLDNIKRVKINSKFRDSQKLYKDDILICSASGSLKHIGKVAMIKSDSPYFFGGFMAVIRTKPGLHSKYLFELLKSKDFKNYLEELTVGANIRNLKSSIIENYEIPIPPIEIQEEIVTKIDKYQKIIDGAHLVVENYVPTIELSVEFPTPIIGDLVDEIKSGFATGKSKLGDGDVPHIRPMNISRAGKLVLDGAKYISNELFDENKQYQLKEGDVLFNNTNSKELVGKTAYIYEDIIGGYSNHMTRIRVNKRLLNPKFLSIILHNYWRNDIFLELCNKWVGQAGINNKTLSNITMRLPPMKVQEQEISRIENEMKLVNANSELQKIYIVKIEKIISKLWTSKD